MTMKWVEKLSSECPPKKAYPPSGVFFRLVNMPIKEKDFLSHRALFPDKRFNVDECISHSLSVFNSMVAAIQIKQLIPALRNKSIAELPLTRKDGAILHTGANPHHYSWWRSTAFDLTNIKIIDQ